MCEVQLTFMSTSLSLMTISSLSDVLGLINRFAILASRPLYTSTISKSSLLLSTYFCNVFTGILTYLLSSSCTAVRPCGTMCFCGVGKVYCGLIPGLLTERKKDNVPAFSFAICVMPNETMRLEIVHWHTKNQLLQSWSHLKKKRHTCSALSN